MEPDRLQNFVHLRPIDTYGGLDVLDIGVALALGGAVSFATDRLPPVLLVVGSFLLVVRLLKAQERRGAPMAYLLYFLRKNRSDRRFRDPLPTLINLRSEGEDR